MKMIICTLLFTFVIFLNSAQSMNEVPPTHQPSGPNQLLLQKQPKLLNNQLLIRYSAFDQFWYLNNGESYGQHHGGGIIRFSRDGPWPLQPYNRQRRRWQRMRPKPQLGPKQELPDIKEGDIMYRHGVPVGRVSQYGRILDIHAPAQIYEDDHPPYINPMDGDIIILNGRANSSNGKNGKNGNVMLKSWPMFVEQII